MQIQISLAASSTKSLKGATKLIAKKGFKIEDEDHDSSVKKGDTFYLKVLGSKYYFIDVDGKDLFQFKIDEKKYHQLLKTHSGAEEITDNHTKEKTPEVNPIANTTLTPVPRNAKMEAEIRSLSRAVWRFDVMSNNDIKAHLKSVDSVIEKLNNGKNTELLSLMRKFKKFSEMKSAEFINPGNKNESAPSKNFYRQQRIKNASKTH